jgi:membrane peptidoglycan carboxypeptidase
MVVLADRIQPVPKRLATVFLSIHPNARLAQLQQFLVAHLPEYDLSDSELWDLYLTYSPERLNLADRSYVAGIHPLELWLAEYLQKHPGASWKEILEASTQVRQEAYSWLFKGNSHKQNTRIRILLEQDAFERIYENWKALGYPFSRLVPSLGTAIGASGDRPDALADLMGTIMNGGVRVPTVTIEHLRFAANTPYDTLMSPSAQPQRVMPLAARRAGSAAPLPRLMVRRFRWAARPALATTVSNGLGTAVTSFPRGSWTARPPSCSSSATASLARSQPMCRATMRRALISRARSPSSF